MSKDSETPPPPGGQFLVYQTEDGKLKIEVRFEGETVWLTQQHMAELFQTTKQNVGQHLKSIFAEGELVQDSVVKDSFTTAADGKNYATRFYNLDAIISVGYRVKSAVATRFRIWATRRLREYIVKGFTMDDERFGPPHCDAPFVRTKPSVATERALAAWAASERSIHALTSGAFAGVAAGPWQEQHWTWLGRSRSMQTNQVTRQLLC